MERLLKQAAGALRPGGTALLEIGAGQGERARALGRAAFPGAAVTVRRDLAGLERVMEIRTGPA